MKPKYKAGDKFRFDYGAPVREDVIFTIKKIVNRDRAGVSWQQYIFENNIIKQSHMWPTYMVDSASSLISSKSSKSGFQKIFAKST